MVPLMPSVLHSVGFDGTGEVNMRKNKHKIFGNPFKKKTKLDQPWLVEHKANFEPSREPIHSDEITLLDILLDAVSYRVELPVTKFVYYCSMGSGYPLCPRCDMTIEREYMQYCDRCGQKLGWDHWEEAEKIDAPRKSERHFFHPVDIVKCKDVKKMDKTALGKRIREARLNKKYTQQKLAEEAGIGIMYIGEIERGTKMPSLNIFVKVIEALDVSADYVLRDELPSGERYICDEIADKIKVLTPSQRKTASDILDAYIRNL